MQIAHFPDQSPYSYLTIHRALVKLASDLGAKHRDFTCHELQNMSSVVEEPTIFFVEAELFRLGGLSIKNLKRWFPNTFFVVLGADSIYFWKCECRDQVRDLEHAHLVLDTMDEVVAYHRDERHLPADSWMCTTSFSLLDYFQKKLSETAFEKSHDFIALFNLCTEYRIKLLEMLRRSNKSVLTGIGYSELELFHAYASSRFVLGTTSASWTYHLRTMKGFRDWIGPACGSVLVYDDHPDVISKFPCPTYPYNNPEYLNHLVDYIDYNKVLSAQRTWISQNTLEKQFHRLLAKHRILPLNKFQVITDRPIAVDSPDHMYPLGTMKDNFRHQPFNDKLFGLKPGRISVMDLGCAGGGFVKSCIEEGKIAIGLEGSDYSKARLRAEWATIPEYLFLCDIGFPFTIKECGAPWQFDAVTCWEVMEHIPEDRLAQLCANVHTHLKSDGLWIMTVSELVLPPHHVTLHNKQWWLDFFDKNGFVNDEALVTYFDGEFVRSPKAGNAWDSFPLVLRKKNV